MISHGFKTKVLFGFCHQGFLKLQRIRPWSEHGDISLVLVLYFHGQTEEKLFSISNFSNIWEFRNRLWYQLLKKIF